MISQLVMRNRIINTIRETLGWVISDSAPICSTCANRKLVPREMPPEGPERVEPVAMKLVMTSVEEVRIQEDGRSGCSAPKMDCSNAAYQVFRKFFLDHMCAYECMRMMLLDHAKRTRGVLTVGQGGITGTTADQRLVFAAALKTLSPGIIVAHNHPSGNLVASAKDLAWTRRLVEVGELHDIEVVDHLILGEHGYLSMKDEGLI